MWSRFLFGLLPLLTANIILSAFDIPIEFPSGVIHLNIRDVRTDPDFYTVNIWAMIEDPDELRLFTENSDVLKLMRQSVEEKWGCYLMVSDEFSRTPSLISKLIEDFVPPCFEFAPPLLNNKPNIQTGYGSLTLSSKIEDMPFNFSLDSDSSLASITPIEPETDVQELSLINELFPDHQEEPIGLYSESEISLPVENAISDNTSSEPPEFNLFFSTTGSDFGGGWRLSPYEIRFLKRQDSLLDRASKGNIESMVLLIAPEKCELYKKNYGSLTLSPAKVTSNILTKSLDENFVLKTTSGRAYFFNPEGQLTHSLNEIDLPSVYCYAEDTLTNIQYENGNILSFEYEGENVTGINSLYLKIHLEYDERNLLCRIYDDQGSSLYITYDNDRELEKIIDASGTILLDNLEGEESTSRDVEKVGSPLLFNGYGEVFCYKDSQSNIKISYRAWDSQELDNE